MNKRNLRIAGVVAASLALAAISAPQIKQVIKVLGVGAAVKQFGPEINKAINGLSKHKDTATKKTKVVPIISVNLGNGKGASVGAAQVTGAPALVDKVDAVAQPETKLFGITIKALIPVDDTNFKNGLSTVDGVGVSGIVDLKV
jgi:hypothetical protein